LLRLAGTEFALAGIELEVAEGRLIEFAQAWLCIVVSDAKAPALRPLRARSQISAPTCATRPCPKATPTMLTLRLSALWGVNWRAGLGHRSKFGRAGSSRGTLHALTSASR
jgi:hypothetical protein